MSNEYEIPENPLSGTELAAVAELGRRYERLRSAKARIDDVTKASKAALSAEMAKIEEDLRGFLERVADPKTGSSTIQAGPGTFYFTHTVTPKVVDRHALECAVLEGKLSPEIFGATLNSKYIKELRSDMQRDQQDTSIPGVEISEFAKVSFRKKS